MVREASGRVRDKGGQIGIEAHAIQEIDHPRRGDIPRAADEAIDLDKRQSFLRILLQVGDESQMELIHRPQRLLHPRALTYHAHQGHHQGK